MSSESQSNKMNIQQQVDYTDELINLKKLVDAGVITQDEFDAKKKQILGL